MKNLNNKKGSAIITAIGMGIVLLIIIASVFSFSRYRTQTVINESKKVKALALAEAGLEVALGELFNNAAFETHKVKINGQELEWESAQTRECTLEANSENEHNFSEESGNSGTISGTLGDGKFKVRVGNIPYKDNENTKAIDESKAYVKIEAMGVYDKTYRKIVAVVNRRYPSREFLMYDGKFLSVVYGQTGDSNNTNVFSVGHLYGHEGLEISQILNSAQSPTNAGTKQKLYNIDAVLSGAGGIFFYSDIDATFFNKNGNEAWSGTMKKNFSFPSGGGTYKDGDKEFGGIPEELRQTPPIPEEVSNWVKDKNSGISIPPRTPSFEQYKKQAQSGGKLLSSTKKYKVSSGYGGSVDAVYLDFGSGKSNLRKGNIDIPSNGIFYSDKDIVIKGNPSKDVSIVSEKNIFVAGDFNQNCTGQNEQKYGFPQDYDSGKNALTADDYCNKSRDYFREDTKVKDGDFRYHVAATIVAKERIVFDHRSAVDCCENELYPYLKYELAKAISDQPDESEAAKVLSPNDCSGVSITASDSVDGFKANIATFTQNFNIDDSSLTSEMESVYNSTSGGKFKDSDLDKLTEVTWKAFKKDYTGGDEYSGSVTSNDNCAVNMLLSKLRAKMCDKNPDDIKEFFEPAKSPQSIKDKQGDYLFYPEMTTNGMFISCGKLNNTFYAGPDVQKYFNEIGYSDSSKSAGITNKWYFETEGFLHRLYGTETNLRLVDVKRIPQSGNAYKPPTRRKVYDDTLPYMGDYSKNSLELSGFIVLSWQDLAANEEEFEAF